MATRIFDIASALIALTLVLGCGAASRKKAVPQLSGESSLVGFINNQEWIMTGGEARVVEYEGQPKVFMVFWGPVPHASCQPYNDPPTSDARTINVFVEKVTTPQLVEDQLFVFNYPQGSDFATVFASEGTVTLTSITKEKITGKVEVIGSDDDKCSVLGSFSVPVCP